MKKDIFKRLITDSQENLYSDILVRDIQLPLDTKKITTLKGVRRCGKTSILFQTILELRKKVDKTRIVYINFEDDRLFPLQLSDFNDFLESYYELFPNNRKQKAYFFFDEIQVVENWEKFIRRLYDTENCQLFLCGSSSKLLSSEIATSLRGRTISFEIFPLSFKEFLRFQNIELNYYQSTVYSQVRHALDKYLVQGGFPELLEERGENQKLILQEYIDLIIYKDLIERFGITNRHLIKRLVKYCFVNLSSPISLNKLFNEFKSQGLAISKNTLYDYFEDLREVYAIFTLQLYSRSVAEQNRNPQKLYSIDTGFKSIFSISQDIGKVIENVVMLHLRRKNEPIYYWFGKQEVDFVYEAANGLNLINVCSELSDQQTKQRELNGLNEAMKLFNLKSATLITQENEDKITIDDKVIEIIPLWKWLIDFE